MTTLWRDLPDRRYDVILADPPWSYYGQQNKWGAAAKFYATAPDEAIVSLPIPDLLTDRGVLFLWATSPRLDDATGLTSWSETPPAIGESSGRFDEPVEEYSWFGSAPPLQPDACS